MKNFSNYGRNYNNIFIKDSNTIIKYSILDGEALKLLSSKPLDFICKPKKFREYKDGFKYLNTTYYSILEFKLLNNYKTLYDDYYTKNLTDIEILELLYKNMLMLKRMHKYGIIHSDIHSKNIMINGKYDLKIIDFDNSIIDDICSIDNNFNNSKNTLDEIKNLSIEQDKKDLMRIYLNRIIYGNFKELSVNYKDNNYKNRLMELVSNITASGTDIDRDYYFQDIIKELMINLVNNSVDNNDKVKIKLKK